MYNTLYIYTHTHTHIYIMFKIKNVRLVIDLWFNL